MNIDVKILKKILTNQIQEDHPPGEYRLYSQRIRVKHEKKVSQYNPTSKQIEKNDYN